MQHSNSLTSYDVFSMQSGSWSFLCVVDATTPGQAKAEAMHRHGINNPNHACVHPTKGSAPIYKKLTKSYA